MTVFKGNGVVWDKANKKNLCRFVDGIYETNDEREIKILKSIDSVVLVSEPPKETKEPQKKEVTKTKKALVEEAKKAGVKGADRMNKDELQAELDSLDGEE